MEENQTGLSRVEQASEDIIGYIMKNGLEVGDKIPNEYELAVLLDVGRSTVRESVKALVSRNVLEIRRGAGTYISCKQGVADDPLGLTLFRDKHKLVVDLMEVRCLIEPSIAYWAATNATKEQCEDLEAICQEVEQLILDKVNHLKKDVLFHTAIANCSGNVIMPKLIPIINQSVELFGNITNLRLGEETIVTHREIVEAIKNKDSKGAQDAMYYHLMLNRRAIKQVMAAFKNGEE